MNDIDRRPRLHRLVLLLSVLAVASLRGQDPRDAMVARAFNEFDAARRLQLLMSALNPTSGPPRGAWPVGVQLLAQTLIEDSKDSLAGVWLRWAVRLSPDLQPDTVQFLPRVVTAYRAARDFVMSTRAPSDSVAATTWLWPSQPTGESVGRLQITSSAVPVPMRVDVKGVGPMSAGGSVPLSPGSYQISATAPGFDSAHVTREVLPGVTTVLDLHLKSLQTQVAVKQQSIVTQRQTAVAPEKKKRFPVLWVAVGAAAVGGAVVLLTGSSSSTGSITYTFNP